MIPAAAETEPPVVFVSVPVNVNVRVVPPEMVKKVDPSFDCEPLAGAKPPTAAETPAMFVLTTKAVAALLLMYIALFPEETVNEPLNEVVFCNPALPPEDGVAIENVDPTIPIVDAGVAETEKVIEG